MTDDEPDMSVARQQQPPDPTASARATTRLPTRRGDVLISWTVQSFALHVVGLVSTDGQQDFHMQTNVKCGAARSAAVAAASAMAAAGRRIFFRNIDTKEWSELGQHQHDAETVLRKFDAIEAGQRAE